MAIKRGGVYIALLVLSFLGYTTFNQLKKISFIEPLDYYELDTTLNQSNDSNLLIGVIGDSWAVQRNIDSVLNQRMIEYDIPTRVISQGYYGGTSKRIYRCMFLPLDADSTIQDIIQAQPQYCLVYSGINDSFRHCGDEFYSYHTRLILKTLIHYNIKPILVQLPKYGIIEKTKEIKSLGFNLRNFILKSHNSEEVDNIDQYRRKIEADLKAEGLDKKIGYISFDCVGKDFNSCKYYFSDLVHMYPIGYEVLSHSVADYIYNDLN